MDRLNQIRNEAGGSKDTSLDITTEGYLTAHDGSSKYFSVSDVESGLDITPIKDVSLATAAVNDFDKNEVIGLSDLSPIGKSSSLLDFEFSNQIEASKILSGGVNIFNDNDNSYDGNDLVIDDNAIVCDEKPESDVKLSECSDAKDTELSENQIQHEPIIPVKDTEIDLQIDGKSISAIDVGNGLYLYRKDGQEELSAVQIIDDQPQPTYKFLKVKKNNDGNFEVYEEIPITVPNEPTSKGKLAEKKGLKTSIQTPKSLNKSGKPSSESQIIDTKIIPKTASATTSNKSTTQNLNSAVSKKLDTAIKIDCESSKSTALSNVSSISYSSTPIKDTIPLTKTIIDHQLDLNKLSENVKKTIEVHTDKSKQILSKGSDNTLKINTATPENIRNTENISSIETKLKDTCDKPLVLQNDKDTPLINQEVSFKSKTNTSAPNNKEIEILVTSPSKDLSMGEVLSKKLVKEKSFTNKLETEINADKIADNIAECKTSKNVNTTASSSSSEIVEIKQADSSENTKSCIGTDESISPRLCDKSKSDTPAKLLSQSSLTSEAADSKLIKTLDKLSSLQPKILDKSITKTSAEIKMVNFPIGESITNSKLVTTPENLEPKSAQVKITEIFKTNTSTEIVNVKSLIMRESLSDSKLVTTPVKLEQKPAQIKKTEIFPTNKSTETEKEKPLIKDSLSDSKLVANPEKLEQKSAQIKISETLRTKTSTEFEKLLIGNSLPDSKLVTPEKIDLKSTQIKVSDNFKTKTSTESESKKPLIAESITDSKLITTPDKSDKIKTSQYFKTNTFSENKSKTHIMGESISDSKSITELNKVEQKSVQDGASDILYKKQFFSNVSKPESNITQPLTESKKVTIYDNSKQPDSSKLSNKNISNPTSNSIDMVVKTPEKNVSHDVTKAKQPIISNESSKDDNLVVINKTDKVTSLTQLSQISKNNDKNDLKQNLESNRNAQVKSSESLNQKLENIITPKTITDTVPILEKSCAPQKTINENKSLFLNNVEKPLEVLTSSVIPDSSDKKIIELPVKDKTLEKSAQIEAAIDILKLKTSSNQMSKVDQLISLGAIEVLDNDVKLIDIKPKIINAAVPFGKWTEANRQEFLNKIKESKVTATSSSTGQIKQAKDLNRRDILKKIDIQRQTNIHATKSREQLQNVPKPTATYSKIVIKNDTTFTNNRESNLSNIQTPKTSDMEIIQDNTEHPKDVNTLEGNILGQANDSKSINQRQEINNQHLIDRTIEGIINSVRVVSTKSTQDDTPADVKSLNEIEKQMNELHGIPFVERPQHELPLVSKVVGKKQERSELNKLSKEIKIPNLLPIPSSSTIKTSSKTDIIEIDSEEEIIDHVPVTGDIQSNSNKIIQLDQTSNSNKIEKSYQPANLIKNPVVIEKGFDRFSKASFKTQDHSLKLNYQSNDRNALSFRKQDRHIMFGNKKSAFHKPNKVIEEKYSYHTNVSRSVDKDKQYHTKLQAAYQTALTNKKSIENPMSIIEDKPVKVVFMDTSVGVAHNMLNIQGSVLSPPKKVHNETTSITNTKNPVNAPDTNDDIKSQDESQVKSKHQRKQILSQVKTPELELIDTNDLKTDVSPKKKRKTEIKINDHKTILPKKSYLLGHISKTKEEIPKTSGLTCEKVVAHNNAASAIDNLVKAAELLETQPQPLLTDTNKTTPIKRGRGRPRKNATLDDSTSEKEVVSEKRPRLKEVDIVKDSSSDDDDDDDNSADVLLKENWTMGKINNKIVCPICNKLFRSENVVFKHVKHCTGVSPSRSNSDQISDKRSTQGSETRFSDSSQDNFDISKSELDTKEQNLPKSNTKNLVHEVIEIEDTPVKEKPVFQSKIPKSNSENLSCEFCGKSFRQLSYLVNHRMQHKKPISKPEITTDSKSSHSLNQQLQHKKSVSKPDIASESKSYSANLQQNKKTINKPEAAAESKSVFSCEVCKKEFRKLHHLVQHRIIHNPPSSVPSWPSRKSSFDTEKKNVIIKPKSNEDTNTGFRCEPCDKSFRKLHHLVEHRETHDCINRQKSSLPQVSEKAEKVPTPPQCDICNKTFRKLHYLIEHKEQHSTEATDSKAEKCPLSSKDFIHECSFCYMVFPNEHALNKHSVFCQRKKRKSAVKVDKPPAENVSDSEEVTIVSPEKVDANVEKVVKEDKDNKPATITKEAPAAVLPSIESKLLPVENKPNPENIKPERTSIPSNVKQEISVEKTPESNSKKQSNQKQNKVKIDTKKDESKTNIENKTVPIDAKPKLNTSLKKKTVVTKEINKIVHKRPKSINLPPLATPVEAKVEPVDNDDEEVRYMINPNFKMNKTLEEKQFIKLAAQKRSSLQLDRPSSKDSKLRRPSLQHPLKIDSKKVKSEESTFFSVPKTKTVAKSPKLSKVPSIDSDDSEVKYSLPKTQKQATFECSTTSKEMDKQIQKKLVTEKRKSLSSIAKRKSLGRTHQTKQIVQAKVPKVSPKKDIKRRITIVEHRCDCGQLFSSAALLARHAMLTHTPPRIRKRRSPPPDLSSKQLAKPRGNSSEKPPGKSESATKSCTPLKKTVLSQNEASKRKASAKGRQNAAHKGVPVPEKMRKLMEKSRNAL